MSALALSCVPAILTLFSAPHLQVSCERGAGELTTDSHINVESQGFLRSAKVHQRNQSAGNGDFAFNSMDDRVQVRNESSVDAKTEDHVKHSEQTRLSLAGQISSLRLDLQLQLAADDLPPGTTREFLKALHLCAPCKNFERFGEPKDGGYVMCTDNLNGAKAAYSYGVNGEDGWGMAVAKKYGVPLHEYDCTDSRVPEACDGCDAHFHSECLLNRNGYAPSPSYKTLATQLQESGFGDAPERSLIGKIDIEAAEWKVFAEEPVSNLKKFKQIVTELHWLEKEYNHPLYLEAMQNLQKAGFAPTHLHGNTYGGGLIREGGYTIPNVVEVTFVPKPVGGCSQDLPTHLAQDRPNDPRTPDFGEFNLPT